jgi:uncharacterized protein (TIGR02466 family)
MISLFSVPVFRGTVLKQLNNLDMDPYDYDTVENLGNKTSKDTYVLDNPKYRELKDAIEVHLNEFMQCTYAPRDDLEVYITQSWFNYTEKYGFHQMHNHTNSILSGSVWIEVNPDSDNMIVYNPLKILHPIGGVWVDTDNPNEYNSDSWTMDYLNRGDIAIFPSALYHEVGAYNPSNPNTNRISMAFNTYVRGSLGSTRGLNKLELL